MASPRPPWRLDGPEAAYRVIRYLQAKGVGLVSPSAHDSCDWSLNMIARAFGDGYRPLLVGDLIHIDGSVACKRHALTTGDGEGGRDHA